MIFDANGNCSIKITEDTSNDFWAELGKLAVENFQYIYVKAIDKNRAVYSLKILFMTASASPLARIAKCIYTTHSAALVRLFVLQLFHSAALS